MTAASTTGTGLGVSGKPNSGQLATLSQGPSIVVAGTIASVESDITSPPTPTADVVFPEPLIGTSDDYVILLTTVNAGSAYVAVVVEDDDAGTVTGFGLVSEFEGDVMYLVVTKGIRPSV